MSERDLEDLAFTIYRACWEQYDANREPFFDPVRGVPRATLRQVWDGWLAKEQKELCRAQARAAARWFEERV